LVGGVMVLERHADLSQVICTLAAPRRLAGRLHCRQQQCNEDAHDGDHHQQFD
jgi:hypothetical protein